MAMRYEHDHENDTIYFAKTNFRNKMQTFGIKTDDRRRHMYVIGKTGMGKTTLLENMILSDIYAGHGCCYIDPHGDTAEKLLDYIPSWRINDVVYFNPADLQHPVGFNILEAVEDEMKHLVAAGMMGVFKKIWENMWSARMEYILNNTILALLDTPGSTLLGINRMLSDADYRKEVILNIKDPIVKQFWVQEFGSYSERYAVEAVAAIQNKIGQFLSAAVIRNIVAQAKSTMDIRKIMDEQMIFICNLSKGRVGEDASRLLGGMLITKIQMSAMERVDVLEHERPDFYMYVDEFQNFAVESFAGILSEARKYRLNLVMAHQYIAQLTEEVRDAVFGNVGTMITFRIGGPDSQFVEDEFMPRFTPEDIINLPKFHIYLKLMIDGVSSQPFSAITLPPIGQVTGSTQKVIEQSRERYAGSRKDIEKHVAVWSGFGEDVDMEKEIKDVKKKKKEAKKKRYMHTYNCTRCSKEFDIPVELDRSRPIYCEECMAIKKGDKSGKGKGKNGGKGKSKGGGAGKDTKKGVKNGGKRQGKDGRRKNKPKKPPKLSGGKVIEKEVGKSVSLDALKQDDKKGKKDSGEKGGSKRNKAAGGGKDGQHKGKKKRDKRNGGDKQEGKRHKRKKNSRRKNKQPKAGDALARKGGETARKSGKPDQKKKKTGNKNNAGKGGGEDKKRKRKRRKRRGKREREEKQQSNKQNSAGGKVAPGEIVTFES